MTAFGLWGRIIESLSIVEIGEIKSIIGTVLIDEISNLHIELNSLEEILDDLKTQNDLLIGSRMRRRKPLPDPVDRRMLESRVKQLIGALHGGEMGGGETCDLGKDHKAYEYYVNNNDMRPPRASSASSTTPRLKISASEIASNPMNHLSAPASTRSAPDVLERLETKLNFLEIDEIVVPLRAAFQDEREELLSDIDVMQAVLEHENERGNKNKQLSNLPANDGRPSHQEVKQLVGKLTETLRQKELFEGGLYPAKKMPFQPSPIKVSGASPLKGRKMYTSPGSPVDCDSSFEAEEAKSDLFVTKSKSRTRSMLSDMIDKGKLDDGLDNDDLKFFA
ncbi:hypothetical protein ScalyP_jg5540 [Parmales sp. scaly parma]|nr:hypothetical protein ScalyP_jg5540 [Parmales sp. scaly parma]